MYVTSTQQTTYTSKASQNKELEKKDEAQRILPVEELIDEDGMAFLNNLLSNMPYEDQNFGKLFLSFQLSINSETVVNGKLHIERETARPDSKSIENKLDLLIAKGRDRKGEKTELINFILKELKSFYANINESNKNDINQEDSVIDEFIEELYSKDSSKFKSSIAKDEIENRVNQYAHMMMEKSGSVAENKQESQKLFTQYKNELLQEYKQSTESSTNTVVSAEQQAIIKILIEENTQKISSLEAVLAAKEVQETKATGKIAEMQEKYKDVYTPIPETYSKEDENIQFRKIHEAYPDYIGFRDFLKIVDSFLEGPKIQLGQELSPSEEEKQKADYDQAYQKAYDIFGGEEAFIEMQKGAKEIMQKYPVNTWGKDERVHNETELARFTNAATYEALEQGKTIEEARIYAGNLRSSFMDTSYSTINFLETLIKAGRTEQSSLDLFLSQSEQERKKEAYEVDFSATNNSTMDLREYGIEGNWEYYKVVESQQGMISEINKKISQFNFMLNNESRIKEAYMKLDASHQDLGNNAGYKRMINENYMPMMEAGLDIFSKYKIYD